MAGSGGIPYAFSVAPVSSASEYAPSAKKNT
jgi:hypothetical protein